MADTMMGLDPNDALNDLNMSESARPLYEHVKKFIAEVVDPMSEKYHALGKNKDDIWAYAPGQLDILQEAKDEAKKQGLWNFFLPDAETGEGQLLGPRYRQYGSAGALR
jgi:acyl-CoA dehydrogenase